VRAGITKPAPLSPATHMRTPLDGHNSANSDKTDLTNSERVSDVRSLETQGHISAEQATEKASGNLENT
jgi:hypothetical protein